MTIFPVGDVSLQRRSPGADALDLAVVVFDRGLDATASSSVFPELRKAESILLPVKLATTIRDSGHWGVVRVSEAPDIAVPMRVQGKILRADGEVLELEIRATTAEGRVLLDRRYRDQTSDADYVEGNREDPFADMYRTISNDLAAVLASMDSSQRQRLERLARMNFAARLAPDTFGDYIAVSEAGVRSLRNYPADGDPMLGRILRLRQQDFLFIDTVDEQYRELSVRIAESYDLWRRYSYELALYGDSYQSEVGNRSRAGRRGSFAALQQVYGSFRKVKLQEEDLHDVVAGFVGESLETVIEVDDDVVRLQGSVAERYAQWRQILSRIFALESGGLGRP